MSPKGAQIMYLIFIYKKKIRKNIYNVDLWPGFTFTLLDPAFLVASLANFRYVPAWPSRPDSVVRDVNQNAIRATSDRSRVLSAFSALALAWPGG